MRVERKTILRFIEELMQCGELNIDHISEQIILDTEQEINFDNLRNLISECVFSDPTYIEGENTQQYTFSPKEPDLKKLVDKIAEKRRIINKYIDPKIFKERDDIFYLAFIPDTEPEFNNKIGTLCDIIDRMFTREFLKEHKLKKGTSESISEFERFLNTEFGEYNSLIVDNLRQIRKFRRKRGFHSDSSEYISAVKSIGLDYPPKNWNKLWKYVLQLYLESLSKFLKLISSEYNS